MKKLNVPHFWYSQDETRKSPLLSKALLPFSYLYRGMAYLDRAVTRTQKSPLPVICIGNLTMGGAGKTPTARAVLNMVAEHGKFATPCFLMRGYGGTHKGPLEVDLTVHTSWYVGDEALMQARYAPVIVSANRYKGARLAQKRGYDLIVMDDGFQNPSIKKDLAFIVVDGGFGFGNGQCFPSGPLREPIASGLSRCNAAIVINRTAGVDLAALGNKKQYEASIYVENAPDKDHKREVVAFAGIARPEKFFKTLEDNGYHIHAQYSFPDHHTFTHGELRQIESRAEEAGMDIITTEKDWIRLSETWQEKIDCLRISVKLEDKFKSALFKALDRLR